MDTIRTFAEEKDYNFTSKLMEYHQRSPIGNSIILENFSRYFRFPEGFKNMVYLSQVQQATAIKTAVEWWRALKPNCLGSIYWQLNDIWPVHHGLLWNIPGNGNCLCMLPKNSMKIFIYLSLLKIIKYMLLFVMIQTKIYIMNYQ
jgi:beta-galactosidase/beta-glucuronidase